MRAQWSHDVRSTWGQPPRHALLDGPRPYWPAPGAAWHCSFVAVHAVETSEDPSLVHIVSLFTSHWDRLPLLQVTMDIKYQNKTPGIVKAIQVGRQRHSDGWTAWACCRWAKAAGTGAGAGWQELPCDVLRWACMLSSCSLAMAAGLNRGTHRHAALVSAQGTCSMCRSLLCCASAGRGG